MANGCCASGSSRGCADDYCCGAVMTPVTAGPRPWPDAWRAWSARCRGRGGAVVTPCWAGSRSPSHDSGGTCRRNSADHGPLRSAAWFWYGPFFMYMRSSRSQLSRVAARRRPLQAPAALHRRHGRNPPPECAARCLSMPRLSRVEDPARQGYARNVRGVFRPAAIRPIPRRCCNKWAAMDEISTSSRRSHLPRLTPGRPTPSRPTRRFTSPRRRTRGVLGSLRARARMDPPVGRGRALEVASRRVVRRRQAERQRQLRRSPRPDRATQPRRHHLGRGAGRPPHADLLGPLPAGQRLRQRPEVARREEGRPRRPVSAAHPELAMPCWRAPASGRSTASSSAASAPSRCATASTIPSASCS